MTTLTAYVHTNKDSTLKVIANLVKRSFPIRSSYSCLYNQFQFVAESLTGFSVDTFFDYDFRDKNGENGHTPQEIVEFANKKKLGVEFSAVHVNNIDHAIELVSKGQPVCMIVSNDNPFWSDTSEICEYDEPAHGLEPGEVARFCGDLMEPPSIGYHAVLLIGYDSKYGFVIGREAAEYLGYKGYFKIKKSKIKKAPKSAAFLAFTAKKVL